MGWHRTGATRILCNVAVFTCKAAHTNVWLRLLGLFGRMFRQVRWWRLIVFLIDLVLIGLIGRRLRPQLSELTTRLFLLTLLGALLLF